MINEQFDIAVGIPTYNEAKTIANVVKQVDEGLCRYFPQYKAIIVNVDHNSGDGTMVVFLNVKTLVPKIYISTDVGVEGKGLNLKNFFDYAHSHQVIAACVVDGDLESILPHWIKRLITPLFSGYDFVFPVYNRYRYDGAITSQLCYPMIAGIYGVCIRQPIGGEFGFSKRYLDILSKSALPVMAQQFGIDVYLTITALTKQLKFCGTMLENKIHRKRDRATLGPMLNAVTHSLFSLISEMDCLSSQIAVLYNPPVFKLLVDNEVCPEVPINKALIEDKFFLSFPRYLPLYKLIFPKEVQEHLSKIYHKKIDLRLLPEKWCVVLYSMLNQYMQHDNLKQEIVDAFESLFFARLLSFIDETKNYTDIQVEQYLFDQAQLFFVNRALINFRARK